MSHNMNTYAFRMIDSKAIILVAASTFEFAKNYVETNLKKDPTSFYLTATLHPENDIHTIIYNNFEP